MALDSFSSCSVTEGTNANFEPTHGGTLGGSLGTSGSGTCESPIEPQIFNRDFKVQNAFNKMDAVLVELENIKRICASMIKKRNTESTAIVENPPTAIGSLGSKGMKIFAPLVIDLTSEESSDSGTSTRLNQEPPLEYEQVQSCLAASAATSISAICNPLFSPSSLKCQHPDSAETQGGSRAVNKPHEVTILSDDDDDDKRLQSEHFVNYKAAGRLAARVEVGENVRSPPPPSPPTLKCQRPDSAETQGGSPAVNKPQEVTILSDNDKRSHWSENFVNYEATARVEVEENVRSPPPPTQCQHSDSAETGGGSPTRKEITMLSDDDEDDTSSGWERFVNAHHVKVDDNEDSVADIRQEPEDDNRDAEHQSSCSTPLVENVNPLTFKRRRVNNGDDVSDDVSDKGYQHPTIQFVEQENGLMQVEPSVSKIPKRRIAGPKTNSDKRKAKELEELLEDDVDEEEEEECGKAKDPDPSEELRKLATKLDDEDIVYEPYAQRIYEEEKDDLEDDFNTLKIFVTSFSGPSSDKSATKSTPEGKGACNHRNFDFDEVMGYYCVDCGTVGLEMPSSNAGEQNRSCAHKKKEYTEEAGVYCEDCGRVWQDIQSIYVAAEMQKALRKRTQKVQEPIHELPQVQLTLQGSSSNNDNFHGADLQLHPFFEEKLHPHQKEGFQFLTEHLLGDQQGSYKSKGCVLGHAPGTGKTLLVISFINSFLTRFPEGRPLILAPSIMLRSWENEFEKHKVQEIPIYKIGGSAPDALPVDGGLKEDDNEEDIRLAPHVKTPLKEGRAVKLREWRKGRSLLLMSYTLFAMMVKNGLGDHVHRESLDYQMSKVLLESPNLVILDEGHVARNTNTGITKALLAMETKRRVLLSGTLFQNNFKELYTLLKLCRHDFMISHPHYGKRILECAANNRGLKDSYGISCVEKKTKEELMRIEEKIFTEEIGDRLENYVKSCETRTDEIEAVVMKLQSLTSSFVDWYPGEILKSLPGLTEYSIHLNLTDFQQKTITSLPNLDKRNQYMTRQHLETAACVHPSLVLHQGDEHSQKSSQVNCSSVKDEAHRGVKITFILRLMASCTLAGEKLLIFCSILGPLTYLEDLFSNVMPGWRQGQQILRLDGHMADSDRQNVIQMFNDVDSPSQVLLASTRACKEGISLVGASRVVILDNLDNPSIIRQAVSRAYRMGQKKKVYVYRLVATHRCEEQVFRRSVNKERLSQVLLDPVATMSRFGTFLQEQRISDIEDELLKKLMITDRNNGRQISVISKYNAVG